MEYIFIFMISIALVLLHLRYVGLSNKNESKKNKPNIIEASNQNKKRRFNTDAPNIDILTESDYKNNLLKFKKEEEKVLIPFALNKDNELETLDLDKVDNILVLGTTGGGKSVLLNELITSTIMNYTKEEVKFITIDSSIVELSTYNNIPHYIKDTITDMKEATNELELVLREIEKRKNEADIKEHLVVIIDDLYDLAYNQEKYIHGLISEFLSKSKNTKVHLILATDTPSEENLPRNIINRFDIKFYLTLSPGTYKEFNIDKDLTEEEIDYMTTIGNGIFIDNNTKKNVKILEASDNNIKEIIKYYSL